MKKMWKLFQIITIGVIIGLAFANCNTGSSSSSGDDNNQGGNYNGNGNNQSGDNSGGNNQGGNNSGGTIPNAPTGVSTSRESSSSVYVSWNSVYGALSYNVYWSYNSQGPFYYDGVAYGTSFSSTGWGTSETGYICVTAVNSTGESSYSSAAFFQAYSSSGGNNNGGGNNGGGSSFGDIGIINSSNYTITVASIVNASTYTLVEDLAPISSYSGETAYNILAGTYYVHIVDSRNDMARQSDNFTLTGGDMRIITYNGSTVKITH